MSGILDWSRYLNLFYTVKDIREHFPLEQEHIVYDFNGAGADGWTGSLNWQTLVIDRMRYDNFNNPKFDQSTVIGYYPEGSLTGLTPPQLILPARMYTGPIIPDSLENVPITVVSFDFVKGSEQFSLQLLLIENWQIGIELGDPRNNANFSPVDGLPSTLLLTVDKNVILSGDTITFTAESDIPVTESLPPNPVVRYFRRTSPTSQVLVTTSPLVNRISTATISTSNLSVGTSTFFATFAGNLRYGFATSNPVNLDIVRGRGLDVKLNINPTTATNNVTIEAIATATIVVGDEFTATQFIDNTTNFRVLAKTPYSGENTNPLTKSGVFTNGRYETTFVPDNSYAPTNITSATYIVNSVVGTISTLTFDTTVIKEYDVELNWNPLYEHLIRGGSTSTVFTYTTSQTVVRNLTPLTVSVFTEDTFPNNVTEVYNNTLVTLHATSNVGRNQGLDENAVEFFARYTPTYNILDYTSPRTPEQAASTSTAKVIMPTRLANNQVLLQTPSAARVGAPFRMPTDIVKLSSELPSWQTGEAGRLPVKVGQPIIAGQAIQAIDQTSPVFTSTYVITSSTLITSGINSGTALITLDKNLPINAYHSSYNTTTQFTRNLDTFKITQPYAKQFTGVFQTGWVAPNATKVKWGSQWFDNQTGVAFTLKRANNWNGIANFPESGQLAADSRFKGANTGYWIHYVWSDHNGSGALSYDNPRIDGDQVNLGYIFSYNPYQEALIGMFTQTSGVTLLPGLRASPSEPAPTSLPDPNVSATEYTYAKSRIVNIQNYTVDTSGDLNEKDRLYFNARPDVTTGTQFSLSGLVNSGNTDVVYSVFEVGNNYLRADPPWYNHVPLGFDQLHDKSIVFNKPSSTNLSKYFITQLTELKYIGTGIPYFTGAYNFNQVKFSTPVAVNSTFKIHGGAKSPVNSVFTVASGPDSNGYYTISPAYSITQYTETEQWRRDNETFNNFQNFERFRNIVVFNDPIEDEKIVVRSTRGNNILVLENIPTNLRQNATFTANLANFTGTYTITEIDPLRETVNVSPAWDSSKTQYLNQWVDSEFTFTNTAVTTSTISLGVAQDYYVSADNTYTWERVRTLSPGTYEISARITRPITTGSNAPFDYTSSSTVSVNIQSAAGLIAPLDLAYTATNATQTTITIIARGATSVNPDHYYVFDQPATFYSNNTLITSSPWTRVVGALEQRASALINNNLLANDFQVRWAGSMNYAREYDDQYLFQSASLAFIQNTSTSVMNITARDVEFNNARQNGTVYSTTSSNWRNLLDNISHVLYDYPIYSINTSTTSTAAITPVWDRFTINNITQIDTTDPVLSIPRSTLTVKYNKGQINRTTGQYEQVTQDETLLTRQINSQNTSIGPLTSGLTNATNTPYYGDTIASIIPELDIGWTNLIDLSRHFNSYIQLQSFYDGDLLTKPSSSEKQIIHFKPQNLQWINNGFGSLTTATVMQQTQWYEFDPKDLQNGIYNSRPIYTLGRTDTSPGTAPGNFVCIEDSVAILAEPLSIWNSSVDITSSTVSMSWYKQINEITPTTGVWKPQGPVNYNLFRGPEFVTEQTIYVDSNYRTIKRITFRKYIDIRGTLSLRGNFVGLQLTISWPTAVNPITFSAIKAGIPGLEAQRLFYVTL